MEVREAVLRIEEPAKSATLSRTVMDCRVMVLLWTAMNTAAAEYFMTKLRIAPLNGALCGPIARCRIDGADHRVSIYPLIPIDPVSISLSVYHSGYVTFSDFRQLTTTEFGSLIYFSLSLSKRATLTVSFHVQQLFYCSLGPAQS